VVNDECEHIRVKANSGSSPLRRRNNPKWSLFNHTKTIGVDKFRVC
jgi:hypothetical protein